MALQEAAEAYLTTLFEVVFILFDLLAVFLSMDLFSGHSSLCNSCQARHHNAKVGIGTSDYLNFVYFVYKN